MRRSIAILVLVILAVSMAVKANSVLVEGEAAPKDLRWRRASIQIAVSSSLRSNIANIKLESDITGAIRRSVDAWRAVADVDLQLVSSEKQNVSPSVAGDGVSLITIAATPENLLLFSKNSESLSATTRVFFNKLGAITEADIVLNPYQQFSTDGTFGTFDLESVLTHEIGHVLGLEHSPLASATMHESYGRNGLYGLQNFASRSLSASDIAAARGLYGSAAQTEHCCGSISGTLLFTNGRPVGNAQVWAEDAAGRVQAIVETTRDGRFRLAGVTYGGYKLFAAPSSASKKRFAASAIGTVVAGVDDVEAVTDNVKPAAIPNDLKFIGFNGQLANMAVPVNAGRTYSIYIGGDKIDDSSIHFTSPYLSLIPNTLRTLDYGDDVMVVTFQIQIDPDIPSGEYSVLARDNTTGALTAIPGGISVGDSPNPFSISVIQKY